MCSHLVNRAKAIFKLKNKYSFGELFYSGLVYDMLCNLAAQTADKTDIGTRDQIWKVLRPASAKEMHTKLLLCNVLCYNRFRRHCTFCSLQNRIFCIKKEIVRRCFKENAKNQ